MVKQTASADLSHYWNSKTPQTLDLETVQTFSAIQHQGWSWIQECCRILSHSESHHHFCFWKSELSAHSPIVKWAWFNAVQVKWVDHKLKRLAVTVDRRSLLHHVWVIIVQNRLRAFLLVALVKNRISTIHNHVVYGCICKWFVSSTVLTWNIVLTNWTDHWVRLRFLKGNRI